MKNCSPKTSPSFHKTATRRHHIVRDSNGRLVPAALSQTGRHVLTVAEVLSHEKPTPSGNRPGTRSLVRPMGAKIDRLSLRLLRAIEIQNPKSPCHFTAG